MGDWQRILVTGGTGFLGGALVDKLLDRWPEARIRACGRLDADLALFAASGASGASQAVALLDLFKPDLVFHLAAHVGGIGANQEKPAEFIRDNLLMGINVLEAARRCGVNKVVVVGTVCSYPKHAPVPFDEVELWNGYPEETNAPYGIAKRAVSAMADAYRAQYGSNFVTAIPANLYGPWDDFEGTGNHVIPALIKRFDDASRERRSSVTLWGTGAPTRDFLYVDDAAAGLIAVAEKYDQAGPINLSSGIEVSIRELAAIIAELTEYRGEIIWDASRPDGQPRRMVSPRRAWELLGWQSLMPLREGLARALADYRGSL